MEIKEVDWTLIISVMRGRHKAEVARTAAELYE